MTDVLVSRSDEGVVLSSSVVVRSNPWLGLWHEASAAAGLDVRDLSVAGVLARPRALGAHLQWPERALSPASSTEALRRATRLLVLCAVLRLRGARVLLTVHNVTAHDGRHPGLERLLWSVLPLVVTDVHAMSSAGRPEIVSRHPRLARRDWHVIPHGHYGPVMGEAPTRVAARSALGLAPGSGPVFTTVGALLPYKGAGELVRAFGELDAHDAVLMLAGRTGPGDAEVLGEAVRADRRVWLHPHTVEQEDLERRVAAADVVVLPYRRVLNSGSAFLALTARRPVLVPDTPTFRELSERVGHGWVYRFSGALTGAHLAAAVADGPPVGAPDLSWCEWPDITRSIAQMWGHRP